MLEEVGLAIRNSWLHDQMLANHAMIADILGTSAVAAWSSGAISRCSMRTVPQSAFSSKIEEQAHARLFRSAAAAREHCFYRHQDWRCGSAFQTPPAAFAGAHLSRLDRAFPHAERSRYECRSVAHRGRHRARTGACSRDEASNLRLVKSMAEHLAHEIGNALVPSLHHQQLLKVSINDPEFRSHSPARWLVG
jgi:hypothetical protein